MKVSERSGRLKLKINMKKFNIGKKTIGGNPYIIAEFGVNHNGSLARAKEGIKKAAKAGADAIKFQTYTADELVVKGTPKFWKAKSKVDEGLNQHEAYKALEGFKKEWYPILIEECKKNNIEFLSTPFSMEAATMLHKMGMKAFKVASSDLSTIPYLKHIAKFNKPILLSTGASTMEEIEEAVRTIEEYHDKIAILHCTLCYPTKNEDANLNIITTLKERFPEYPIGLSDHTLGIQPPTIAAAMGAVIIEKHYTVDKELGMSADHWLSVDPEELAHMVSHIRQLYELNVLKGSSEKQIFPCEKETRKFDKRSIVSAKDINKGQKITEEMLTYKRPGTGIWPKDLKKVIGKKAKENIKSDTTLQWSMIN